MKKKTVVQISGYFLSGMSYQENIYCSELSKRSALLNLFISSSVKYPKDGSYSHLREVYTGTRNLDSGVYYDDGVVNFRLKPLFEKNGKVYLRKLLRTLSLLNPDVVLVHGSTSIVSIQVSFYKIFFRNKFKLLVDDHTLITLQEKSVLSRIYRFVFKMIFSKLVDKAADLYLPLSKETESIMVNNYGLDKSKMKILYLGADDNLFKPEPSKRISFREKYRIKRNEVVFLYTGKIIESKKIDEMIGSFKDVTNLNYRIIIVGPAEPKYKSYLEELILNLEMEDQIEFVDNMDTKSLVEAFNGADIGIWPFAPTISTVEAQLCGLPCIVQSSEYNRERIVNDTVVSGMLVNNVSELKNVIVDVLSGNQDMATLRENSIKNSQRYKNSVIVESLYNYMVN